ncbi:MAG: T9SS type A sorting domain-containing protein, partial [Bacteroidota bacterium]
WYGTLTLSGGFKVADMYKVFVSTPGSLHVSGAPVSTDNTSIQVNAGWNHLGYTPQVRMTVEEALAGLNPQEGDLVKTETEFAVYSGALGWVGSLDRMQPGQGYMLYVASDASFSYPRMGSLTGARETTTSPIMEVSESVDGHNMSVIARVTGSGRLSLSEALYLVAFANDAVVGYSKVSAVQGKETYFVNISAKAEAEISFQLYDQEADIYYPLAETITYQPNDIMGQVMAPKLLSLQEEVVATQEPQVYPNPFEEELQIIVPAGNEGTIQLTVYEVNGKVAISGQHEMTKDESTTLLLTEEVAQLPKGLYVLRLQYGGSTRNIKLVK